RTFVPTVAMYLLRPHKNDEGGHGNEIHRGNFLVRGQKAFERGLNTARDAYGRVLGSALSSRKTFVAVFVGFTLLSLCIVPFLGQNFFPRVDSGSIVMHVRAPVGTRIEETSALFDRIERQVRELIPTSELSTIVDNIGVSTSGINVTYNASGTIGPQDGDVFISLKEGHHPTDGYVDLLRQELTRSFPSITLSFLPADVTSQILNFGSPSPVDIQVISNNPDDNQAYARRILKAVRGI